MTLLAALLGSLWSTESGFWLSVCCARAAAGHQFIVDSIVLGTIQFHSAIQNRHPLSVLVFTRYCIKIQTGSRKFSLHFFQNV